MCTMYTKDCGRREESWPREWGECVPMTALKAGRELGVGGKGFLSRRDLRHLCCESQTLGISPAGAGSPELSYQPVSRFTRFIDGYAKNNPRM